MSRAGLISDVSTAAAVALLAYVWWIQRRGRWFTTQTISRASAAVVAVLVIAVGWGAVTAIVRGAHLPPWPTLPGSPGAIALLIVAFGRTLFGVGSVEALSQVASELEPPRIRNLQRTARLVCLVSLVITGLAAIVIGADRSGCGAGGLARRTAGGSGGARHRAAGGSRRPDDGDRGRRRPPDDGGRSQLDGGCAERGLAADRGTAAEPGASNASSPIRHTVARDRCDGAAPDRHRAGERRPARLAGRRLRRRPALERGVQDRGADSISIAPTRAAGLPGAVQHHHRRPRPADRTVARRGARGRAIDRGSRGAGRRHAGRQRR